MAEISDTEQAVWGLLRRAERAEANLSNLHAEMWACSDRIEKLAENMRARIGIRPTGPPDEIALAYEVAADEIRAVLRGVDREVTCCPHPMPAVILCGHGKFVEACVSCGHGDVSGDHVHVQRAEIIPQGGGANGE